MTELLIRMFIRNKENPRDEKVRLAYSTLAGCTGIVCNILLFLVKYITGTLCGSIAIVSDAFNNLSDCLSNLVSLLGFRLAAKPADKEHPFGHGRIEYLVSLAISVMIIIVAWELFRSSLEKILHPSHVESDYVTIALMLAAIAVKAWMGSFYQKIADRTDNPGLHATAADSRNDVLATSGTLAAVFLYRFSDALPFDGIAGVIISILIFKSGFDIASGIVSQLLGGPADRTIADSITDIVLSYDEITGIHDIIVHNYGAGSFMATAHAEMDGSMTLKQAHDIIDQAERRIQNELHIVMTIHMDPSALSDPRAAKMQRRLIRTLNNLDSSLTIHDFQRTKRDEKETYLFDIVIPFGCTCPQEQIDQAVHELFDGKADILVNYDHEYTEGSNEENIQ